MSNRFFRGQCQVHWVPEDDQEKARFEAKIIEMYGDHIDLMIYFVKVVVIIGNDGKVLGGSRRRRLQETESVIQVNIEKRDGVKEKHTNQLDKVNKKGFLQSAIQSVLKVFGCGEVKVEEDTPQVSEQEDLDAKKEQLQKKRKGNKSGGDGNDDENSTCWDQIYNHVSTHKGKY